MAIVNTYSIVHFLIWFMVGRYTKITWLVFMILSLGWELLELMLPFEFAVESLGNKLGDIIVNMIGFRLGLRIRNKSFNK
ncbi:MAG: hypothetical protein K9N35_02365 [Candidatus Marinimicrobia bacterium]|nr:hypothetical protein [Candidatus Neomarinimicrobiota bacterium]